MIYIRKYYGIAIYISLKNTTFITKPGCLSFDFFFQYTNYKHMYSKFGRLLAF